MNRTLFDKIWDRHVAGTFSDGRALIAIDRHVVQETKIDAGQQEVGAIVPRRVENECRAALLVGMDELDVLLGRMPDLDAFQRTDRVARPWVWPDAM